jgi:hypothetical protein
MIYVYLDAWVCAGDGDVWGGDVLRWVHGSDGVVIRESEGSETTDM